MYISVFDLFKVGIGPSSSHTVGPMLAANKFSKKILSFNNINRISIELFGSLAHTGIGHGSDKAILLGLSGHKPETITTSDLNKTIKDIYSSNKYNLSNGNEILFNYNKDFLFNKDLNNNNYSNTMLFRAYDNSDNLVFENKFYSIGGGFIIDDLEDKTTNSHEFTIPFDFSSGDELLSICKNENQNIYDIVRINEENYNANINLDKEILKIWKIMNSAIYNGMTSTGNLSGDLNIKKRANSLYKKLLNKSDEFDPLYVLDWVNIFAIAVSEENASFGKIVTSPTNGASGIIPSVIKYYKEFIKNSDDNGIIKFILTSSAIGTLFKKNASISGAEAGCQGEIGVACSMAAAGLTAALDGTCNQIENAAEIAMEHNLGLTCDPVNGLVQIPCIERNAMGSIKAINACRLALSGSGEHKVSLDQVIKTMWETGKDMKSIYKETSKGGLAVNVIEC